MTGEGRVVKHDFSVALSGSLALQGHMEAVAMVAMSHFLMCETSLVLSLS